MVLGSRGLGGFCGLLVGSTGVQVAAQAPWLVIVMRPVSAEPPPDSMAADQVVVGVDGSSLSVATVEFGFVEAVRLGVGGVLCTWPDHADPMTAALTCSSKNTPPNSPDHSRSPLPVGRKSTRTRLSGASCCAACRSSSGRSLEGSSPACRRFPWSRNFAWTAAGFRKPCRAPSRALPGRHRAYA